MATHLTQSEADALHAKLEELAEQGTLDRASEANPAVAWRFEGAGGNIKLYRSKKGRLTILVQPPALKEAALADPSVLAEPRTRGKRKQHRDGRDWGAAYGSLETLVAAAPDAQRLAPEPSSFPTERDLSDDQRIAYEKLLRWAYDPDDEVLTLGGYAGTGKSTLVALLARELVPNVRIAFTAFTGKAASVLQQKLRAAGVEPAYCGTLHRLLYSARMDEDTGRLVGFSRKDNLGVDLVILDEASMVGEAVWTDLRQLSSKILAVGDHGQLEPVGDRMISLMKDPLIRLEKIHRQALGNPILAFADHVRRGYPPEAFESNEMRVRWIAERDELRTTLTRWFSSEDMPLDSAALVYTNRSRVGWNQRVREISGRRSDMPEPGEVVICLRNDDVGNGVIVNGMRGVVEAIDDAGDPLTVSATIAFPTDNWRLQGRISRHQFGRHRRFEEFQDVAKLAGKTISRWEDAGLLFDHGYALTVHKAQGSQFARVALYLEHGRHFGTGEERARWLYTGATRAVDELVLVPGRRR